MGKHNFNLDGEWGFYMEGEEGLSWERSGRMGHRYTSFQILLQSTQNTMIYNKFHLIFATARQGRRQRITFPSIYR